MEVNHSSDRSTVQGTQNLDGTLPSDSAARDAEIAQGVLQTLERFQKIESAISKGAKTHSKEFRDSVQFLEKRQEAPAPAVIENPKVQSKAEQLARQLFAENDTAHYAERICSMFLSVEVKQRMGRDILSALGEQKAPVQDKVWEHATLCARVADTCALSAQDVQESQVENVIKLLKGNDFAPAENWLKIFHRSYSGQRDEKMLAPCELPESIGPILRQRIEVHAKEGAISELATLAKLVDLSKLAIEPECRADLKLALARWLRTEDFYLHNLRPFVRAVGLTTADYQDPLLKAAILDAVFRANAGHSQNEGLKELALTAGATEEEIQTKAVAGLGSSFESQDRVASPLQIIFALKEFGLSPAVLAAKETLDLGERTLAQYLIDYENRHNQRGESTSEKEIIEKFALDLAAQKRAAVSAVVGNLETGWYNGTSGASVASYTVHSYKVPDSALSPNDSEGMYSRFPEYMQRLFVAFDIDTFQKLFEFCNRGDHAQLIVHLAESRPTDPLQLSKRELPALRELNLTILQGQLLVENGVAIAELAERRDFETLARALSMHVPPYNQSEGVAQALNVSAKYFGLENTLWFIHKSGREVGEALAGLEILVKIAAVSNMPSAEFFSRILKPAIEDTRMWGQSGNTTTATGLLYEKLLHLNNPVALVNRYPVLEPGEFKIVTNRLRVHFPTKASILANWDAFAEFVVRYCSEFDQVYHGPDSPTNQAPLRDLSIYQSNGLAPRDLEA